MPASNGAVRLIGPVVEEEIRQLEQTREIRDVLIMQDALDERAWDEPESDDPRDGPGAAIVFALALNQHVPARHRLCDTEIASRMMRYRGIPKRQLLKEVYRGWRSLGARWPRGKLFPPARIAMEGLGLLFDLLRRMNDGRLDAANSTTEELVEEIEAVMRERKNSNI